jgi:hypothetical protein
MDHPPWAKAKTSHLPLPESHPNSARLTARHQFTQAFLLITGALPAKRLIANELALDISLAPGCDPSGARMGMKASHSNTYDSLPDKVLDFGPKPEYGTLAAYRGRAIRNL